MLSVNKFNVVTRERDTEEAAELAQQIAPPQHTRNITTGINSKIENESNGVPNLFYKTTKWKA